MAKKSELINYNDETLRVRRSFLWLSSILFTISFAAPIASNSFKLDDLPPYEINKLVLLLAAATFYKATYYAMLLSRDHYMNWRLAFSKRKVGGTFFKGKRVSSDGDNDPFAEDVTLELNELLERLSAQITNDKELKEQVNKILSGLSTFDKRYANFSDFYRTEQRIDFIARWLFMIVVPYILWLIVCFLAFSEIRSGWRQLIGFLGIS